MEIILSALAEAIIGILIEDLAHKPQLQNFRDRLKGNSPEKLALQRALANSYIEFSRKYRELSTSLFDEYFLQQPIIVKELAKQLTPNNSPNISVIAEAWYSQFHVRPSASIDTAIDFFLERLQNNIKSETHLKPFVDSRALDQLHTISESSSEQVNLQSEANMILAEIKELLGHRHAETNRYISGGSFAPIPTTPLNLSNLPHKHPHFVGRNQELREILHALSSRAWIVSIDGIGGVGKTTLALEVAHELKEVSHQDDPQFVSFIWISARDNKGMQLNEFLTYIWEVLSISEVGKEQQDLSYKRLVVHRQLSSLPCLLIFDNFETITDEGIYKFVAEIPEPSKILITSRHHLQTGEKVVTLGGLDEASSINLLRAEAKRLDIQIPKRDTSALRMIAKKTYGIPYILRWVMEMVHNGKTMEWALNSLESASSDDVFDYVFAHSLSLVDDVTKSIFYSMYLVSDWSFIETIKAANPGVSLVPTRVSELVALSLLEDNRTLVSKYRKYRLPSIARYLVERDSRKVSNQKLSQIHSILKHYIETIKMQGDEARIYIQDEKSNLKHVIKLGISQNAEIFDLCSDLSKVVTTHDDSFGKELFQILRSQPEMQTNRSADLKSLESLPNPFVAGPPIHNPALFFGREEVLLRVRENFEQSRQIQSMAILGERRIGKTSFLLQLQNVSSENCSYIYINFAALSGPDFEFFLTSLMDEITRQILVFRPSTDLSIYSNDNGVSLRLFDDFIVNLTHIAVARRLVLMFDEFEAIMSSSYAYSEVNDFLDHLRALISAGKLNIITASSKPLSEIAIKNDFGSTFFGIFISLSLTKLSKPESLQLIQTPSELDYQPEALDRIFALTQGHPMLIQLFCYAITEYCNKERLAIVNMEVVNSVEADFTVQAHNMGIVSLKTLTPRQKFFGAVQSALKDVTSIFK